MSKEELASLLYDSLNNKIATLPDDVVVYPAHGLAAIAVKTWARHLKHYRRRKGKQLCPAASNEGRLYKGRYKRSAGSSFLLPHQCKNK